jgi:hypothetical protein
LNLNTNLYQINYMESMNKVVADDQVDLNKKRPREEQNDRDKIVELESNSESEGSSEEEEGTDIEFPRDNA